MGAHVNVLPSACRVPLMPTPLTVAFCNCAGLNPKQAHLASNLLLLLLIGRPLLSKLLLLGSHILCVVALVHGRLAELRLYDLGAELVQELSIVRHYHHRNVLLLQVTCITKVLNLSDCDALQSCLLGVLRFL